jgi:signal transduction histidine kinase
VKDFEIRFENDVSPAFSRKVDSEFYKVSEIELDAIYDGKGNKIIYNIKDKYNNNETTELMEWKQLLPRFANRDFPEDVSEDLTLGPVVIKLLFFLREAASLTGTSFKLSSLRQFLDNNAGVKIYRDNFAVRPYGFPNSQFGYDWLELGDRKSRNPAGVGRGEEYMVTPNQLIGAVFISRDINSELTDSAGREGLVESVAFSELTALVKGAILMLETHRAKIYPLIQRERKSRQITSASKEAEKIKQELSFVNKGLTIIKEEIEEKGDSVKSTKFIKPISSAIEHVESVKDNVDSTITELLNWQRVLSGLATMGISSAVFGHETENSIAQFKTSVTAAKLVLSEIPPNILSAMEELEKALKHSKKVAAWGAYALTRVQREKRSKRNIQIFKTIDNVVNELKPAFDAASIKIKIEGDNFYSKTFQMDIESILVNLLTNSYTACLLKAQPRNIQIRLEKEERNEKQGYLFVVADSGPGIAKEFLPRIFEPLFSTKTIGKNDSKSIGTGLGLTIVKSIIEDLRGEINVDHDPILKGARFNIWLPKEE